MADLIQNVQDVYKKWESRSSAFSTRGSRRNIKQIPSSHRSFGRGGQQFNFNRYDDRRFKQRGRDRTHQFRLPKFEDLAQFKMAPCVVAENKPRPFMGSCCSKCLPISRANVADKRVFSLSVCNVLSIPHFHSIDFNVVLNILKNKAPLYPDASIHVLKNERVYSTVEKTIAACGKEPDVSKAAVTIITNEEYSKAKRFLDSLKASISTICYQISSVFVHCILSRVLNAILVHKGQIEILKSRSEDNIPIIYLPVHQSNLDYILISFVLYMNSLKVPLVIADSDSFIPILGYFTKFLGAVYVNKFIQRELKRDELCLAVTESYLAECLMAGHNLEFFIEGGRCGSRTPPLLLFRLLSFAIDSVEKENIDDVYISTVSISYEKIIDENSVSDQLGKSKSEENILSRFYSFWKKLHCNFGNVRLNFGQPFSLKEFVSSCHKSSPKPLLTTTMTPPPSPGSSEEDESLGHLFPKTFEKSPIFTLFQHVVYDSSVSTSLMSTQLVAFLFTTQYRKGATQQQLQNSLEWLRVELSNKKRDAGFTGESSPVMRRAVELLGRHLVATEVVDMEWTSSDLENNNVKVVVYKPVVKLPHVLELQCYSAPVVPLFLLESMVVNALYALVDVEICHFRHCDSKLFVFRDKVIDKAVELNEILQFEFMSVPPCAEIAFALSDVLDQLVERECLQVSGTGILPLSSMYSKRPHQLSFEDSDEEDDDSSVLKQQQLKIVLSEESINHLEFLRCVLSPYIESYWIAAISLLKLIDEVKEETVFIQDMQITAQDKLCKGLLAYEESFSADTFKNALKLFERWCILCRCTQDGIRIVYLSDVHNCKEKINDVVERIEQFRK